MFFLILFCSFSMRAQEQNPQTDEKRNLVKMNLTGVVFRNFQFAYERTITKRLGVQVSYGFIPTGQVPLVDQYIKDDNVNNIRMGGSNFTV